MVVKVIGTLVVAVVPDDCDGGGTAAVRTRVMLGTLFLLIVSVWKRPQNYIGWSVSNSRSCC